MKNHKILSLLIVIVIVVSGILTSRLFRNEPQDLQIVCTMEALLCPDGSYVGRAGPQCQFSKCGTVTSLVGTLRQDANGFNLVMESPESGGMGVSYVTPLVIKVGNVLGQMVGKKVEVFGDFSTGNQFNVERLEELAQSDPSIGTVGVGKTVYINGVRITVNNIVQDSRCPVDVTCIRAGNTTFNITLQSDTDKETRDIISDEAPLLFDSYKILVEKVLPNAQSNVRISAQGYVVTFKVVSN